MLSEPTMRIRPKLCLKFVQIMSGQWRCQVYNMKVINKMQQEKKENIIKDKKIEEVVPRQDIITTERFQSEIGDGKSFLYYLAKV